MWRLFAELDEAGWTRLKSAHSYEQLVFNQLVKIRRELRDEMVDEEAVFLRMGMDEIDRTKPYIASSSRQQTSAVSWHEAS